MKIQLKFIIDRRKKAKQSTDLGLIELRVSGNGDTTHYSTRIKIPVMDWVEKWERVSKRNELHEQYNEDLTLLKEKIMNARREAEYKGKSFGVKEAKAILTDEIRATGSFSKFAIKEIEKDNFIKRATKYSKINSINKLVEFSGSDDVLFSDLTSTFMHEFINYLKGTNVAQNTIRKHNKNIKSLIECATRKELFDKANPCKEIKIKELETKMDVLTWKQVEQIINLKFEDHEKNLEHARDMFIFSCCTGLRISDTTNLKTDYVKQSPDGIVLDFYTIKVNKHAIIPLHSLFPLPEENTTLPIKILNKYFDPKNPLVFPKRTEQVINRHLKSIGQMIGTKFNLTSHIGRKSFATHMARRISTPTLKRLLQHSNIRTTERYVHLSDQMVNEDLKKVDWGN